MRKGYILGEWEDPIAIFTEQTDAQEMLLSIIEEKAYNDFLYYTVYLAVSYKYKFPSLSAISKDSFYWIDEFPMF